MKTVLLTLLTAALLALAGAAAFVGLGVYDISALSSHTRPVYWLLETTMQRSVRQRAAGLQAPDLREPHRLALGAACYRQHCVQCHGGPGVAPEPVGQSLQPLPGPLVDAARRWRPEEVYWITRHGIKMSGMPAWQLRLSDEQLWAVVAFVDRLAEMSPADYARAAGPGDEPRCAPSPATADAGALPLRGRREQARLSLRQHGCIACHRVPGVVGPETDVGPPLQHFARRTALPGGLPNNRENLVRWLREPQQVHAGTAMPDMRLSEHHATLIADYLLEAH